MRKFGEFGHKDCVKGAELRREGDRNLWRVYAMFTRRRADV